MIIECCSQERSFKKFFGLLGQVRPVKDTKELFCQYIYTYTLSKEVHLHITSVYTYIHLQRFCMLNKVYVEQYDRLFQEHVSCGLHLIHLCSVQSTCSPVHLSIPPAVRHCTSTGHSQDPECWQVLCTLALL